MKQFVSTFAVLVIALSAAAARAGNNPMYDSWARHGVGTSVTQKGVTEMMGNKSEMEVTTTLLEKSPEKVVLETKTSMVAAGQKIDAGSTKVEILATAPVADPGQHQQHAEGAKPETKESEESVAVAGKQYQAKVTETTMKQGEMTIWSKSWTSPEVPGMVLKTVSKTDGQMQSETTMELTDVTIK